MLKNKSKFQESWLWECWNQLDQMQAQVQNRSLDYGFGKITTYQKKQALRRLYLLRQQVQWLLNSIDRVIAHWEK